MQGEPTGLPTGEGRGHPRRRPPLVLGAGAGDRGCGRPGDVVARFPDGGLELTAGAAAVLLRVLMDAAARRGI